MSLQKYPNAMLRGFRGPAFPPAIDSINQSLASDVELNPYYWQMGQMAKLRLIPVAFPDDSLTQILKTSDGYKWYTGFYYAVFNIPLVVVLVPFLADRTNGNGSHADRSVAVYSRWIPNVVVNMIATRLAAAMQQYYSVENGDQGTLNAWD